jgi:hypothetical protein
MNETGKETIQLDGPYLDILALKQQGLCCSQIVVKLVLRDLGRDNPDLVRSMASLCLGGYTGGTCGILTGAACALSLALCETPNNELPDPMLHLLLGELSDWFTIKAKSAYGGSRCSEILTVSPDKRACTLLLVATMERLQFMLATAAGGKKGDDHVRV